MSPVVCVFARKTSEPLTSLVKQLDSEISKSGKKLCSFVVLLTDDEEKTAKELKSLAKDSGITHVPLTISDAPSGSPAYKIAKDADITVMMWKGTKVAVNRAFADGKMTEADAKALVTELPKILGN